MTRPRTTSAATPTTHPAVQGAAPGGRRRHGVWASAAALLLLGTGAAALGARPSQDDDLPARPRAFQLYDSLAARAVAESARDHIAARRWPEALVDLQRLVEEHRGEVLGATRPVAPGARNPSQGDVHLGASHWAERLLFSLPAEAQALYRERHGARADEALRRALGQGDRGGLSAVARRWPLTDAGQRAWWALGDLEVERGESQDGLRAWARGAGLALGEPERIVAGADDWRTLRDVLAARAAERPSPVLAGALARVEFALAALAGGRALDREDTASILDGPAEGTLIDPNGFGNEGWPREWRTPLDNGANPFGDMAEMRVFAARDASAVYVNTSRAVHAIGAFSGETLWTHGAEELGWDRVPLEQPRNFRSNAETSLAEYAKALDTAHHIVAPAVARGVVVAALHLPLAYEKRDQFNRIEIIDVIPERRLVGIDARTGKRLWDTFPPADWDGDSGEFAERMTVVGPPTIVGARVLAPVARQRGRIELHLGCYDLATGAVLWSTPLVTGQVPLNMFGRQVREFSAPSVAVQGGTVVVQTNLGVLAAVDLFTGDTLWETVYEQIPIQAPSYYEEGSLKSRWRNTMPAIVGGTVVATPLDGLDLVGLDLATGALRWSVSHQALLGRRTNSSIATELLLGADEQRVYLFVEGYEVWALRAPEGVENAPPTKVDWRRPHPSGNAWRRTDIATPALDASYVYLPGAESLTIVDRATGRLVREVQGDLGSGNLLVSHGALVAASAENVTAAFEWRGMVVRAEAAVAAAPDDPRPLAELARLYLVRADALALGDGVLEAARLYGDAARVLEERGARASDAPRLLREPLFRAFLGDASLARRALDAARAEERIRLALDVAPDGEHRREALLALQAVQRRRAARAADTPELPSEYERTLAELASKHGADPLTVSFQPALGWSPGGLGGAAPDPWVGALVPSEARQGRGAATPPPAREEAGDDAPGARARTTVGLWATLELLAEDRRRGDAAGEVARLYGLVAGFGDEPLPGGSGAVVRTWAAGRLGLLRRTVDATAFAPFEADAATRLERVRESRDAGELARIAEQFPGTDAARRANDLRLDLAVTAGEVEEVARIVLDPLPPDSSIGSLDERDLRLVLRLAAAFGQRGNTALRAALAERIAAVRPDLVVDLEPHRGERIGDLAAVWREVAATRPRGPVTVTEAVTSTQRIDGDFVYLGADFDRDGLELAIFQSEAGLVALQPGARTGVTWNTRFDAQVEYHARAERARVGDGLIHVAARDRILCVRSTDGQGGWTWYAGEDRVVLRVDHADGVVLARTAAEYADGTELLVALDGATGVELWRRTTPQGTIPVAGEGRLVLVLEVGTRAEVIDLFLGGRIRTLEVGTHRNIPGGEGWIAEGRYVLPQFQRDDDPARNQIVGFDLETGEQAWRVDLEAHRGAPHVLLAVLEHRAPGEETRRLCVVRRADAAGRLRTVHVLNERLGALDRGALVELRDSSEFVELASTGRVVLPAPVFFVTTTPANGPATLRAVDVRLGTLWDTELPRSIRASEPRRMFAPLVGETHVVVATVARRNGSANWELNFFDRRAGVLRETRVLPEFVPWQEIVGVAGTLFLAGIERLERME